MTSKSNTRPPKTWLTADHHFGHQAVIGMCNRPFSSVADMDDTMIELWNSVVQPEDHVWHLGDFGHKLDDQRMRTIFQKLNGSKSLIVGNHDHAGTLSLRWRERPEFMTFTAIDGLRVHLSHYALRTHQGAFRGAVNFYGHSHGRLPGHRLGCDVGVDAWDYLPVEVATLRAHLAGLPLTSFAEGWPIESVDELETGADQVVRRSPTV